MVNILSVLAPDGTEIQVNQQELTNWRGFQWLEQERNKHRQLLSPSPDEPTDEVHTGDNRGSLQVD